jgi:hypothetical protein
MAITYTWKIDMMHTQSKLGVQNAVTEIHWSKTGTDETGATGRYPGCTKFNLEEIAALNISGNFTPLENLTEAQVITWVQSTITSDDMSFIDSQIQSSIDQQKSPKIATSIDSNSFPWAATN